jgi:Tol biopolymer transport system component
VLGRRIGLGLTLIALCLGAGEPAVAAEWPPGPRLTYIREGAPIAGEQVISAEPSGERWFRVATIWSLIGIDRPAYSPDGSKLAIGGFFMPSILITSAEHVEPRPLAGSAEGFAPVFSPDGQTIAFTRLRFERAEGEKPAFVGASIWLLPASGGKARQLTPWRNREVMVPASFSPDGATLVAERGRADDDPEVVLQPVGGGRASRIAKNATDPAFSPDGTEIAVVRSVRRPAADRDSGQPPGSDLFVLDTRGRVLRRLTRTPGRAEEDPSWDPSGERLAFTQLPAKELAIGSSITEINADGSCRRKIVFTLGLSYSSPVWQTGPGREAGRIEC